MIAHGREVVLKSRLARSVADIFILRWERNSHEAGDERRRGMRKRRMRTGLPFVELLQPERALFGQPVRQS